MVIIGYGNFHNYRIEEVPDSFLAELAARFKLCLAAHGDSGQEELRITIAVHEEVQRRSNGGKVLARELPLRELAVKLVTKGFQHLSKEYHPDRGGTDAGQTRLNTIRSLLMKACAEMNDDDRDDSLIVPAPTVMSYESRPITDEDIPF